MAEVILFPLFLSMRKHSKIRVKKEKDKTRAAPTRPTAGIVVVVVGDGMAIVGGCGGGFWGL